MHVTEYSVWEGGWTSGDLWQFTLTEKCVCHCRGPEYAAPDAVIEFTHHRKAAKFTNRYIQNHGHGVGDYLTECGLGQSLEMELSS